ncbi:MAG TPA: hypothetical protein VHB45_04120 [Alloacidobacterium sp.]|nr:hypothetical protein [Alloacidobacterium sp.]
MTRVQRWGKATKATLLGWAVAFMLTSLIQIVQVIQSSGHDLQLVLAALGFSIAVWLLLTFVGALVVWLCVVSPVALFCAEAPLLLYRTWVTIAAIAVGVAVAAYLAHAWTYVDRAGVGAINVWAGVCFAAVFSGVTAHDYFRFLSRNVRS